MLAIRFAHQNTTLGPVKGYSYDGVTYFHSIPFAAPPTGDRRFKAPEPATPWTDVLDVTGQPNICSQIKIIGDILMGHEDCMYLHVYIPDHDPAEQLPVLFWIYGGECSIEAARASVGSARCCRARP